jgi:hypothetical protein
MGSFSRNLSITADQAIDIATGFISNNHLGYTLEAPEIYPGYCKFHTTITGSVNFGMDIMVNGYNGEIWMNSFLGVPVAKY